MEKAERELILQHLEASRARLLAVVEGLSTEQLDFRPAEGRWSVADCVEHLTVVENFVWNSMHRVLEGPPEIAKRAEVQGKEELILSRVPARVIRVKGPEPVMPKRRWPEFSELLRQFDAARTRTLAFASESPAGLQDHFFPHPFLGELDCCQWLLFLGTHCERHVRQMEEVKADPGFPKSLAAGG